MLQVAALALQPCGNACRQLTGVQRGDIEAVIGTEDVYKIYAESFEGEAHLARIQAEAKALVDSVLAG